VIMGSETGVQEAIAGQSFDVLVGEPQKLKNLPPMLGKNAATIAVLGRKEFKQQKGAAKKMSILNDASLGQYLRVINHAMNLRQ
jgi:hypothetical protein